METLTKPTKTKDVLTTSDYSIFYTVDGNRDINPAHVRRLVQSMKEKTLFTIITVNERMEIIDGQHRFSALMELGKPINYVVCKGYGVNEIKRLNVIARKWNADDFLSGYCDEGRPEYLKYKEFKENFKIGHQEVRVLLSGSRGRGNNSEAFNSGNFVCTNLKGAYEFMRKINMILPFYKGAKRRSFIYAMLELFKKKEFDFKHFLGKLKQQQTTMVDCVDTEKYIELIEEVYNYRSRNKVNLRF